MLLPLSPCFAGFFLRSTRGKGLGIPVLVRVTSRNVWKANRLYLGPLLLALGLHLGPAIIAHSDGDLINSLVSRTDSAGAALTIDLLTYALCLLLFSPEIFFFQSHSHVVLCNKMTSLGMTRLNTFKHGAWFPACIKPRTAPFPHFFALL